MLSSDDSSAVELSELSNTTRPRFDTSRHTLFHFHDLWPAEGHADGAFMPEVLFPRRAPDNCGELTEERGDISGHKQRTYPDYRIYTAHIKHDLNILPCYSP